MKDFLETLIKGIVDKPHDVSVVETTNAGLATLELTVNPADMGKVIGKSGKIIRAIRDLTRTLAVKRNLRVNVVLREE